MATPEKYSHDLVAGLTRRPAQLQSVKILGASAQTRRQNKQRSIQWFVLSWYGPVPIDSNRATILQLDLFPLKLRWEQVLKEYLLAKVHETLHDRIGRQEVGLKTQLGDS